MFEYELVADFAEVEVLARAGWRVHKFAFDEFGPSFLMERAIKEDHSYA